MDRMNRRKKPMAVPVPHEGGEDFGRGTLKGGTSLIQRKKKHAGSGGQDDRKGLDGLPFSRTGKGKGKGVCPWPLVTKS